MENKSMNLEVIDNNGKIIPQYEYNRVDFNDNTSILSYGDDVKGQISKILDSITSISPDEKEIEIDEKELLALSSFGDELDKTDEENEKNKNASGIKKSIERLINFFKGNNEEEKESTYKQKYQEYCKLIERISVAVENQKQSALNDINTRNNLVKQITPVIAVLEELIIVGKQDRDVFAAEIATLESKDIKNLDEQHLIQYKNQLLKFFNGKINELEKGLIAYKEQIQAYRLQQNNDMEIVLAADNYLRDSAPILKAQGSIMVFNHIQEKRIEAISNLNQAVNAAIVDNAYKLEQNSEAAVELALNKGISTDTLQILDSSVRKGIQTHKDGRKQLDAIVKKDAKILSDLNNALETYQQELLQLIDDQSVIDALNKDNKGPRRLKRVN